MSRLVTSLVSKTFIASTASLSTLPCDADKGAALSVLKRLSTMSEATKASPIAVLSAAVIIAPEPALVMSSRSVTVLDARSAAALYMVAK